MGHRCWWLRPRRLPLSDPGKQRDTNGVTGSANATTCILTGVGSRQHPEDVVVNMGTAVSKTPGVAQGHGKAFLRSSVCRNCHPQHPPQVFTA